MGKPHPLRSDVFETRIPEGLTIAQMLGGMDTSRLGVRLAGSFLPKESWKLIRPKAGTTLEIVAFPQGVEHGSGAEKALQLAAVIGVIVLSALTYGGAGAALFPSLGASFAAGGVGSMIAAGVISAVGMMVINAIVKPSTDQTPQDQTHALNTITGVSNQANPYGAVPCVLGDCVFFPPLAAMPYSELSGDRQYIRMLLDCGYGTLELSEMKIGDTDFSTYTTNEVQTGENPPLFSTDVAQTSVNFQLENSGDTQTITTPTGIDEIMIDIEFPGGLFGVDANGKTIYGWADFKVETSSDGVTYKRVTDPTIEGLVFDSPSIAYSNETGFVRVTSNSRDPIRGGIRWKVVRGQHQVRVTRQFTSVFVGQTYQVDGAVWSYLQSVKYTLPSTLPTTKIALRVEADPQLNGNINQFNLRVKQLIPVWDGSAWVTQACTNPAWIYYWLLTACPANGRKVDPSRVDFDAIYAWAQDCDAHGYVFSKVIAEKTTLWEILSNVCAAGRATFNVKDGLYSVVRDTQQTAPVQHFTPRNTSEFQGARVFTDAVHALRCRFSNAAARGQQDEVVVYDDGYSEIGPTPVTEALEADGVSLTYNTRLYGVPIQPGTLSVTSGAVVGTDDGLGVISGSGVTGSINYSTGVLSVQFTAAPGIGEQIILGYTAWYGTTPASKFETMQFTGVDDPAAVWRLARYHLAVIRLRQNEYTWKTDIEHMVCQRGDLVKVAHDVPRWGAGWARIESVTINESGKVTRVVLDSEIDLPDGPAYVMRVRTQDNQSLVAPVTSTGLQLIAIDLDPTIEGVNVGDLAMFGKQGLESVNLIVSKITPGQDMTATITAVDEAPAVYTAADNAPPAFVSKITGLMFEQPPDPPEIVVALTTTRNFVPDDGGVTKAGITVKLNPRDTKPFTRNPYGGP